MSPAALLVAFLGILFVAGRPGPGQAAPGVRIRGVEPLVRVAGADETAAFRPPFTGGDIALLPPEAGAVAPVPEAVLQRLLEEALGEEGTLHLAGETALLAGDAAGLGRATALLDLLEATVGAPVRVKASWLECGTEEWNGLGPVLAARECAALEQRLRRGGGVRVAAQGELCLRPGGAAVWRRLEATSRLGAYEVEVASKVSTGVPAFRITRSGCLLRLRAAALPGGRVALFADAWRVWDRRVRRVAVREAKVPWVELESARLLLMAGSGVLARGEGLLFRDSQAEGSALLLLQLLEAPGERGEVSWLGPLLVPWHLYLPRLLPPWPGEDGREEWLPRECQEFAAPIEEEQVARLLQQAGLEAKAVLPAGAVVAGPLWRTDLWARLAGELGIGREQTRRVEFLLKGLPAAEAGGLEPEEIARRGKVLHHLAFPVLLGREGVALAGREALYLRGYDVEVAEKASFASPAIGNLWSGLTLRLRLAGGASHLEAEHHWTGEPEAVPTGAADAGPLERAAHRMASLRAEPFPEDRFLFLGEAAAVGQGAEEWRVVAEAAVR